MRNLISLWLFSLALVALYFNSGDLFTDEVDQDAHYSLIENDSSIKAIDASSPLPNSLKMTEVDGGLSVDEEGNLIITPQIKNLFDYFLMTLGEEDLQAILARIDAYLSSELQEPALSQAKKVLSQYIEYKDRMYALSQSYADQAGFLGGEYEMLQRQLDMQTRIRREVMQPETVQAFFEYDEIYDQWSLDRLKIGADESLSIEQRNLKLSQMEEDLPEEIRTLQRDTSPQQSLRQLQSDHSFESEQDKFDFYKKQLGEPAAQRLQLLDEKRAKWQARLDDYFVKKNAILSIDGLHQSDRDDAISELRVSLFSKTEQRRLSALEEINQDNS